jgi:hypothetical protein
MHLPAQADFTNNGNFNMYASKFHLRGNNRFQLKSGVIEILNSQMSCDSISGNRAFELRDFVTGTLKDFFVDTWSNFKLRVVGVSTDDVRIHNTIDGFGTFDSPAIIVDASITSSRDLDARAVSANGTVSLINPKVGLGAVQNDAANCWIKEIYTVNINVADKDGAALSGVAVKIEDQAGQVVSYVDSETDLNEAVDMTETGIDVDDGTKFSATDVILMDSEFMSVDSIATNTLTVTREYLTSPTDGYKAGQHQDNGDIYITGSPETDGSGDILEQMVASKQWYGISENLSTYSPHKVTLSKAGYETLVLEDITIDAPIVWHLELKASKQPPAAWQDGMT